MGDIVAMLRVSESDPVQQEAAEEIERLREENARLKEEVERQRQRVRIWVNRALELGHDKGFK